MSSDWSTGLLDFRTQTPNYAWAAVCPCLWMENIGHFLIYSKSPSSHNLSWLASCAASTAVDIPVIFCLNIASHKICREWWFYKAARNPEYYGHDDVLEMDSHIEEQWNPENSSYDWWVFDWCWFYTNAALENCCSTYWCGQNVHTANFPSAFACCVAAFYPVCIYPLAFILRIAAKEKLNIQNETCISSCLKTVMCMPCSLVQIHHSLDHATNAQSLTINSMK